MSGRVRQLIDVFVALVDGAVVGFCSFLPRQDEGTQEKVCEISAIYVHPDHWRRGIGRLLCEKVLDEARRRELEEVSL